MGLQGITRRIKDAGKVILQGAGVYDSTQSTRQTDKHFRSAHLADRAPTVVNTPWSRKVQRSRVNYEYENNEYMQGVVRNLTLDMIGNTYPSLQVLGDDAELTHAVEDAWCEWAESTEVNWPSKLNVLDVGKWTDGERFLTTFRDNEIESKLGVSLNFSTVSSRRVTDPTYQHGWLQDGCYNDDGVLVNAITGRPIAYLISTLMDELLSGYGSVHQIRVEARQMFQWFAPERPDQFRGYPKLAVGLNTFAGMRRFDKATLTAAETAASFAAIMKTTDPAIEATSVEDWATWGIQPGLMLSLPDGRDITQLDAKHPIPNYDMYIAACLRKIGALLDVPYGVIAHDLSNYNFASGRLEIQSYMERKKFDRLQLAVRIMNPCHDMWVLERALSWMESMDATKRTLGKKLLDKIQSNSYRYQWRFYNRPSSNPVDDATANEKNLQNGLTTLSDVYGDKGENYRDKVDENAKIMAYVIEKYGPLQQEFAKIMENFGKISKIGIDNGTEPAIMDSGAGNPSTTPQLNGRLNGQH